ncbi:putative uncharacterized protein DDB_G0290521 [Gigantopelta aegis]|uniref:putative uncharacterized protein DDB_G0290521 n=1 Tax=Gigantopelta aegis TaxID=1735272 RepID=UPI001B88AB64|nr:putative uncharacterized protein DDB_G0290521 [Gigantopelta aegis]
MPGPTPTPGNVSGSENGEATESPARSDTPGSTPTPGHVSGSENDETTESPARSDSPGLTSTPGIVSDSENGEATESPARSDTPGSTPTPGNVSGFENDETTERLARSNNPGPTPTPGNSVVIAVVNTKGFNRALSPLPVRQQKRNRKPTYADEHRKLKLAEDQSDLQTDPEEALVMGRLIRKRKKKQLSSSSSEDDDDETYKPNPTKKVKGVEREMLKAISGIQVSLDGITKELKWQRKQMNTIMNKLEGHPSM